MKITLTLYDGRTAEAKQPFEGCQYVEVAGLHCECARDLPLIVAGIKGGVKEDTDRYMVSSAACARCKGMVGDLRVEYATLFGREEDDRVLNGRPRVY